MFRYRPYKECLTEAIIPVAIDYGISGAKKYVSNIKSYDELSSIITNKDYHLYEVCSADIRRIYFDIDEINFTEQDLNEFIIKLTKTLEIQLKIKIQNDEVVVLTNEGSVIYSVHIIYKNLKMESSHQKKLVEYLNESDLNEKNIFDNSVYSKNRLFRCLYQTKTKSSETKGLRLDFKGKTHNPLDTFICNTINCELVEYTKEVKPINRCKRNIQPTELIEYILELSPKSIFIHNRRRSWNNISLIIKNYRLYDVDKWCELSIEGTRFTKKDNMNFVEENTTEYGIDYIYYLMNNFVVENPYIFYKTEVDTTYLLELFDESIVETLTHFINNDEKENGKIVKTLQFSVNGLGLLTINKQTGFIVGDNFKINYHYDKVVSHEYPNILQLDTITDCRIKLESGVLAPHESKKEYSKLFVLKSSWGTGKTHNILKSVIHSHLHNKILIITSSNSLNQTNTNELNQYIRSMDEDAPLFVSHIETQNDKTIKLHKYSKVVCSIQSLHKIKDSYFDVIFMDEFESILNAYYGYTTFKKGIKGQFLILNQLLCKSSKIIALDADISKPKIDLLIQMIDEPNPVIVKNNDKSFQNVKFIIHTEPFIYQIIQEIINKKKLVIPSASQDKASNLLHILTNTMKKNTKIEKDYELVISKMYNDIKYINILYIDRDGCKVYKNKGMSHEYELFVSTEVYKNIEAFIKEQNIDVFIYTPTITCGLSINESYFDKCYSMSSNRSVNYLEFIQMIMRVRKLNDNENHIFIANTLFNTSSNQMSLSRIKQNEADRNKFITTLKKNDWYGEEMIDEKINEFITELDEGVYSKLQMINALNQVNTEMNFVYNIFSTLNYHKLNVSYYTDTCELEKVYNPQKNKELVNEVLFELWDKLPILSVSSYYKQKLKIVMELDNDDSYWNFEEETHSFIESYKKTNLIFNALKLSTIIIQELNEAIAMIDLNEIKNIFNKTYDYKGGKILLLDLISIEGMFDGLIKNRYDFWTSYVLNNQYGKLKKMRQLVKEKDEPFVMNHTSLDVVKMEHELLKIFMKYLNIDIRSKETYTFTNQDFEDKINKIPYDDFKKLVFLFEKSHNVPRENAGNIYKLVKRLFVSLDYNLKYEDKKHTTRAKDTFSIIPSQKIVNRKKPIQKEIETLDKRFKHLEDRSSPFMNHGTTDIQKGLHYIITNQLKKVSVKKLQSSLLLQNPNIANELFYYNPYHYLDLKGATHDTFYYDKNRNRKTDTFDLHNSQIVCYNGDKKNITRPYIPKNVVVKTTHLGEHDEISDLINNLINLICIRSDLKEHFEGVCGLVEL